LPLNTLAFQRLVDEHSVALYRVAFRMLGDRHEAEDMVQETYRCAWKSRAAFEEGRGDRAWLVSILRRRIIDRWRKTSQPRPVDQSTSLDSSVPGVDPFATEYTDEMQAALNQLPPELRETLLLVVVAELTHQEAADLLGIPLGTVLSRVSRARTRLREQLLAARKIHG
jgi:RNA polymerase sigma-70 factor (ECF subfamily)